MTTHRFVQVAVLLLAAAANLPGIAADAFPSRPLRLILPFPADGATSLQAQMLAPPLRENLGRQLILEHRPGAGGLAAAEAVARAAADGYVLLLTASALAIQTAWLPAQMPLDPRRDLAPVGLVSASPLLLAVHPGVPARSVAELVALAKRARPEIRTIAAAAGSAGHVAMARLAAVAPLRNAPVLMNGGAAATRALLHGDVDAMFVALPLAVPLLSPQRLRPLAVTAAAPVAVLPEVPLLRATFPGLEVEDWHGLFAPRATPAPVIARLHAELGRALRDEAVRARFESWGLSTAGGASAGLAERLAQDIARYEAQLRNGELKLQ